MSRQRKPSRIYDSSTFFKRFHYCVFIDSLSHFSSLSTNVVQKLANLQPDETAVTTMFTKRRMHCLEFQLRSTPASLHCKSCFFQFQGKIASLVTSMISLQPLNMRDSITNNEKYLEILKLRKQLLQIWVSLNHGFKLH